MPYEYHIDSAQLTNIQKGNWREVPPCEDNEPADWDATDNMLLRIMQAHEHFIYPGNEFYIHIHENSPSNRHETGFVRWGKVFKMKCENIASSGPQPRSKTDDAFTLTVSYFEFAGATDAE